MGDAKSEALEATVRCIVREELATHHASAHHRELGRREGLGQALDILRGLRFPCACNDVLRDVANAIIAAMGERQPPCPPRLPCDPRMFTVHTAEHTAHTGAVEFGRVAGLNHALALARMVRNDYVGREGKRIHEAVASRIVDLIAAALPREQTC